MSPDSEDGHPVPNKMPKLPLVQYWPTDPNVKSSRQMLQVIWQDEEYYKGSQQAVKVLQNVKKLEDSGFCVATYSKAENVVRFIES